MRRAYIHLIFVGLAIALTGAVADAQTRTRTVAATGQSAPGGGIFVPTVDRVVQKGLPTIAGSTIAFGSDVLVNGQSVYGVYSETNSVMRVVTRTGAPAPGGGTILDVESFSVDRFGNVFVVLHTSEAGPDVIARYSFGALSLVAKIGDTLPGDRTITGLGVATASDGTGGVYFQVTYSSPTGAGTALVRRPTFGDARIIVATGTASPGGGTFGAISPATIASTTSGLVAFTSTVDGGPGGIFVGIEGNLTLADTSVDALPNLTVSDNDDADLAFMRPGSSEIRLVTIDGTGTAVASGTTAPRTAGRISFGEFKVGMAADFEGHLFFFAPVTGDNTRGAGLFRRDRFTNAITAVVLQGDPAAAEVSGVYGLFAIPAGHPARIANDDGKIVFAATAGAQSGSFGFFTTLGVPEGLIPSIANVSIKKGKLTVVGSGFEPGARILVNGNPQADTKNNKKSPTTKLQSKSAGTAIAPGATVSLTVSNPSGLQSAPFSYTRPR